MNIRFFAALAACVTFTAVSTDSAYANNPNNTWRDCVTVNGPGKYVVTPGFWTMNGIVIGQTWIGGGSVQGPAGVACSNVRFPNGVTPNDFHFVGDQFLAPNGNVTIISGDYFWGNNQIYPLVAPVLASMHPTANLGIIFDWNPNPNDPFMQVTDNGGVAYAGPLSGFVASNYNLLIIGAHEFDQNSASPYSSFCAGDGSGTGCPCGNNSAPFNDEGCLNSLGGGGKLMASGTPSVSADTFVLQGSQMPNSFVLYFQGTQQLNGGNGAVFGDGLRCAGGSIIRLGIELNSGGASHYPTGSNQPVSVKGAIPATGGSRAYQGWYRDAANFCTTATFNLTNGILATWTP